MLVALFAWCLMFGESGDPGFLLITSSQSPLEQIRKGDLRQLYLKKRARISGQVLVPLHLKGRGEPRQSFERRVFSAHFDVDEYWRQQRLQAGEKPPLEVASEAFMLVYVERNPGYIGYVATSQAEALKGLRVKVLRLVD